MHFSFVNYFIILAALLCQVFVHVGCFEFNFPSFEEDKDVARLILSNNSRLFGGAIQVTPDVRGAPITDKSGRALYRKPFRLWKGKGSKASFNTTFVINVQNQTSTGGEGLAFILTGNKSLPENSDGQWLGIVNANSNGSSQAKIVAVEFDTRKSYTEDLDDNHVGLNLNTIYSVEQVSLSRYGINILGNDDKIVRIEYDGNNLTVFVGKNIDQLVEALSQPLNFSDYLPGKVYLGFSGSTSSFTELNCIRSWEFSGSDIEDSDLLWVWITVPAVALALVCFIACYLHCRRKSRLVDLEGAYPNIEDHLKNSTAPKRFRLRELRRATGNFDPKNKLGKGGFGTVYKGVWGNTEIAVKRVSKKSHQGKQEFISEVTTIGNLNHKNLVRLIGWCYESRELLLVYECMPNGSLDKFIFCDEKACKEDSSSTLNWETRLSVIHGVAQALEYLHHGCEKRVLHRDIKASNIMLDSDFNARLGDFGLARTIQEKEKTHHSTIEIAGTPGYMAPETFLISRATVETDVYSFGVLILEVVCGRKPGNQNELSNYNNSIVNWLWELYRNGKILDAADCRLNGKFSEEEIQCVLILGLACCHPNPHYRPCMKTVLQVLRGEANPPDIPHERPSFVWPAMPPSFSKLEYSLTGSQLAPFSELSGR